MDSKIWRKLPIELIRRIVHESSPTIDVQLAFRILPKKIPEDRAWRLWYLLNSHDGLIYNLDSKSLHVFRLPGYHMIRRPVELSHYDDGLWFFNSEQNSYAYEINCPSGAYCFLPACNDPYITEFRVLLKGSGIARAVNYATGATS